MTAPTPEQMRALAEWLDVFGAGSPQQAMPEELSDSADALRAAADEVDRLRREVARNDPSFWKKQSETWKRLANDERAHSDRLRAVIEEAPHDSGCQFSFLPEYKPRRCTCWKAELS